MKGTWNGMVLVATGKDTNNKLVLLAFIFLALLLVLDV